MTLHLQPRWIRVREDALSVRIARDWADIAQIAKLQLLYHVFLALSVYKIFQSQYSSKRVLGFKILFSSPIVVFRSAKSPTNKDCLRRISSGFNRDDNRETCFSTVSLE